MKFTAEDQQRVGEMMLAISKALRPFNHNTEAAFAVMALVKNARTLLDRYPSPRKEEFAEGCAMYLKRESPDEFFLPFDPRGPKGLM